jgi:uncharacterized protein
MPDVSKSGPAVDLSRSPNVKLHPISIASVSLTDRFWEPRVRTNREVTLGGQLKQCRETGRLENFERAAGKKDVPFQGIFFNDSDVYKWLEAASYSAGTHPDPELEAAIDEVIEIVAAAQQPNGYLNTYYMFEKESERFSNLKDMHEIYCAGHLIQAAVAHHRATGKTSLLTVATRLADHLYSIFGPGKRVGACGHEEAEMALVELYRVTGNAQYLELARCMTDARGHKPPVLGGSPYHQDHLPITDQKEMTGHAVRHLYYLSGVADILAETSVPGYAEALEALWQNFTRRRIYVTGGAGSRYEGEAFGADYELPNDRAYTETCAAIASVMWNWRMLNITGEARFADLMEHTLFNAVLPGLSLDGEHYFYENPLADTGKHRRQAWFGCACCPPNIARLLSSLTGYFYSTSKQGVYVHLYAASQATISLESGGTARITQSTDYPWDGAISVKAELSGADSTILHLRIPSWARRAMIRVNGKKTDVHAEPGEYAAVTVKDGTTVTLTLPMAVERITSHAYVRSNMGRIALKRGPLIYCIEAADHPGTDVRDIALPDNSDLVTEHHSEMLGGITLLKGQALAIAPGEDVLYMPYEAEEELDVEPVDLTAIPYYAWANREPGGMEVWIPTLPEVAFDDEASEE